MAIFCLLGSAHVRGQETAPVPDDDESPLQAWFTNSLEKVTREATPPRQGGGSARLLSARNDWESCQLVLRTTAPLSGLTVAAGDLVSAGGQRIAVDAIQLALVDYVPVVIDGATRWLPDPLLPLTGPFSLAPGGGAQPVWVTVRTPADASPGVYTGNITVAGRNLAPHWLPLTVEVVDVTLPPDLGSWRALCLLSRADIAAAHGLRADGESLDALHRSYYRFLSHRRLTPIDLPVAVESPEAEEFLNDPLTQAYRIPYSGARAVMDRRARYLRDRGWLARGIVYPDFLNPDDVSGFQEVGRMVDDLSPEASLVAPMPPDQRLYGVVNTWCPRLTDFNPRAVAQREAAGDHLWWRLTDGQNRPLPTLRIDDTAVAHRVIPWLQLTQGVDGLLVSSVNGWRRRGKQTARLVDVWSEPSVVRGQPGSSFLLYPGAPVDVEGPVSSLRLEILRDGLEDVALVVALEHALATGGTALGNPRELAVRRVREVVRPLAPGIADFVRAPQVWLQARNQLLAETAALAQSPFVWVTTEPEEGAPLILPGEGIVLSGVATPGSQVDINGHPLTVRDDGRFRARGRPAPGENIFTITAALNGRQQVLTRRFIVQADPVLAELETAIDATAEAGVSVDTARSTLKRASERSRNATYDRQDREQAQRTLDAVYQDHANALLDRLTEAQRNDWVVAYPALLVNRYVQRGEPRLAIQAAEAALHTPRAEKRRCQATAVKVQGEWGFRLTNGIVTATVSRRGGRIIDWRVCGIPLLRCPADRLVILGASWTAAGGFVDAGESLGASDDANWNMVVVHDAPERVTLSARWTSPDGRFKVERLLTLRRHATTMELRYLFHNLTEEQQPLYWRGRMTPGIGFSRTADGDPGDDRFELPASDGWRLDRFPDSDKVQIVDAKTLHIDKRAAGAYDPVSRVGFAIIADWSTVALRAAVDTHHELYSFELLRDGEQVAAHDVLTAAITLVALPGVDDTASFAERLAQRAPAEDHASASPPAIAPPSTEMKKL